MRLGINDEGMARIATQLRIGQDIQIDQGEGQTAEGQGEVTITRVAEDQEDENSPLVAYFSNGLVFVQLPTGLQTYYDSTNPSGTGSFQGGDGEEKIQATQQAVSGAAATWDYRNNEPLNAEDDKWVSLAQESAGSSAQGYQDAAQDYYGVPNSKM